MRPVADAEKEDLPTIESIAEQRRERRAVQLQLERQREREAEEAAVAERLQAGQEGGVEGQEAGIEGQEGGIEGLEAEADQQGAFNPETGEINWDCPCLGGMATGPCGDEFKAAFSCFVFSKEEPKGMDCIDKFKSVTPQLYTRKHPLTRRRNMQNCFRQYPEVYGSEIDTDDDEDDMTADAAADVSTPPDAPPAPTLSGEPAAEPKPKSTPSGPHSPAKLAENRRELGLVPSSYRPAEDEASPDDEQKTQ